jgi:hypothetical protein
MRNFFFLILLLSCSKQSTDLTDSRSQSVNKTLYSYGTDPLPGSLPALDNTYAPKDLSSKVFNGHAPMNFLSQYLVLTFDLGTKKVTAVGAIQFEMSDLGKPYFDLNVPATTITLDGVPVVSSLITDPDGQNEKYWTIDQDVAPGVPHELVVSYELPAGRATFTDEGGVRLLTSITDLNGRFFEDWVPVGFESDAFELKLTLSVPGIPRTQQLFTNGVVSQNWEIDFPPHYTKSSFYVHFTDSTDLIVKTATIKSVPVKVYSESEALVEKALAELPGLFEELESDYGPYPHPEFLAYVHGGMEYVGATITSLGSLDHELLHSWFGRGMIPADGHSGWIDEAVASWRDYGYFQASSVLKRPNTNLANYSPFPTVDSQKCV